MTADDKIAQIQQIEQKLQQLLMQKHTYQNELVEVESAEKALEDTKTAYRIIGSIMVELPNEKIAEELKEKEEEAKLRIKSLDKQ